MHSVRNRALEDSCAETQGHGGPKAIQKLIPRKVGDLFAWLLLADERNPSKGRDNVKEINMNTTKTKRLIAAWGVAGAAAAAPALLFAGAGTAHADDPGDVRKHAHGR
jgi:hypothetical protein